MHLCDRTNSRMTLIIVMVTFTENGLGMRLGNEPEDDMGMRLGVA